MAAGIGEVKGFVETYKRVSKGRGQECPQREKVIVMKRKTLFAFAVALALSLLAAPAFASTPPSNPPEPSKDSEYLDVDGTGAATSFKKYLITELGQELPQDLEFKYTIEPGTAVPAGQATPAQDASWTTPGGQVFYDEDEAVAAAKAEVVPGTDPSKWTYPGYTGEEFADKSDAEDAAVDAIVATPATPAQPANFEIFAGPNPEDVVIGTALFEKGSATSDDMLSVIDPNDSLKSLPAGKVYSRREVALDFSGVTFDEPGVYRYIVTEKEIAGVSGISYDTQIGADGTKMVRVVDVYVVESNPDNEKDPASATDPKADKAHTLVVNEAIMHEVVTSILTTDENGSKDENAIIATKWAVLDVPAPYDADPGISATGYDTQEAAESDRKAVREKIHDDILAQQAVLDGNTYQQAVTDAQNALDAAKTAQDVDGKQTAYDNAKAERESKEATLATKQAELANTTDPATISVLRAEIDVLKGDASTAGSIAEAQAAEDAAKAALDAAKAAVQTQQDAYDAAVAALQEQQTKLTDLQDLYDSLGPEKVVETAWKLKDKTDNYVNEIDPLYNLQFHKKVTGNQGSRDKYFKFDVEIKNLPAGGMVTIDGANSVWTRQPSKTTATTYDADDMKDANDIADADDDLDGIQLAYTGTTFTHTFYLKHDEYIRVLNLPKTAEYTVTEVEEDYKSTLTTDKLAKDKDGLKVEIDSVTKAIADVEAAIAAATDEEEKARLQQEKAELQERLAELNAKTHNDNYTGTMDFHKFTGYTNTKNGVIPTGVLMSIGGGVLLALIAMAGLIMLNRRRAEED